MDKTKDGQGIPLCIPNIGDSEWKAVQEVLFSGWLTHGEKNLEFEEQFARYIGSKYAVSVNSCASALFLSLIVQDIKGEVIIPSFTHVATANAVVTARATPVFADIEYSTCNMDPSSVEACITRRTEAIIPVHYAGQSCHMDRIMAIAARHGLAVIEDSAENIGGTYAGRRAGSFGTGCFSFFPTKNLTTGEGGMVTTDDLALAERIRAYAAHGIASSTLQREKQTRPWLRAATYAGFNFRLSNLQAAIGVEQLKKIDEMNACRRKHAEYLSRRLAALDCVDLPVEDDNCLHVYQMYTIKLKNIDRTPFMASLRQQGVGASVHFDPPVHLQPFYKGRFRCQPGGLPVTEAVAYTIVTLPMFPQLTTAQLDRLVEGVQQAIIVSKPGS